MLLLIVHLNFLSTLYGVMFTTSGPSNLLYVYKMDAKLGHWKNW